MDYFHFTTSLTPLKAGEPGRGGLRLTKKGAGSGGPVSEPRAVSEAEALCLCCPLCFGLRFRAL